MIKHLDIFQTEMKRRFKEYKHGRQQGLPMVWDNMMSQLKAEYAASKKKQEKTV